MEKLTSVANKLKSVTEKLTSMANKLKSEAD